MSDPVTGSEYEVARKQKNHLLIIFGNTYDDRTKELHRIARASQDVVRLVKVPFPPLLREEDLIGPKKNSRSKSKAPNSYFIYRKWYTICLKNGNQRNNQTSLSPYISEQWKEEPQYVKDYYRELSKRANNLFREKYGESGMCEGKTTFGKYKSI